MTASGFVQRKAKSLIGEIAALAVLAGVVSIASAQPKDYLRYKITATTDLTSAGGIKDTGTGKNNGTEISLGAESAIVPGHAAGSFAVFLAGNDAQADPTDFSQGTGIDTGTDAGTAGIGGAFTAMAFLYRGSVKNDNMVFGTAAPNSDGSGSLHLGFRGAACYVGFWGNDSSGPVVSCLQWHHWAVRYDGTSNQDIFIDGVLVHSEGGHGPYGNSPELLIGRTVGNNGAFSGAIDDARLFQQALRNDQIAAIASDNPIPP
jgi:hypothetical protein